MKEAVATAQYSPVTAMSKCVMSLEPVLNENNNRFISVLRNLRCLLLLQFLFQAFTIVFLFVFIFPTSDLIGENS